MNEVIKVSVLIPAYNEEPYIDQCLESVMNQTLREIEIIVVENCSSDLTLEHIEAAAKKDSRIRIIRNKENAGTMQSRKISVLASCGEYVMFVDGDDYLELDACKTVYERAAEVDADILQFGISVENCGNLLPKNIQQFEETLNRYKTMEFLGQPLVRNYTEDRLSGMVLQKAVKGETAKRAFQKMTDLFIDAQEDEYITCILLMESKSLSKIPEKLYHYCYGRGVYGHRGVTLQQFSFYCGGVTVWQELGKYASELPHKTGEEYIAAGKDAAKKLRKYVLNNQLALWLDHMKPEDQPNGYLMMEQAWKLGGPGFVGLLAQNAWGEHTKIAEAISGADWLKFEGRPIRTIALYYVKLTNGGTERVMALLCNLFAELRDEEGDPRFKVVLITEEPPSEDDYPLTPLVIRKQIPRDQESRFNYIPRAAAWDRIIDEQRIDMILYPNWRLESQFMDFLTIKRTERKPALVMHMHIWSPQLYQGNHAATETKKLSRISDGVVTLSETDRLYWSRCNPRSVYIPNPCYVKASECRRAAYGKHILWLARIASQKQPLEIPRIMREAVARDPEIVCHVVGAWDTDLEKGLRESIAAEGLSEHVILDGFHADVTPFYEKSSLFLLTSRFEGFALTLYEAASHGLPTVLYEMPWLAYNDLIDGAIAVPQLDASAAAEAIVRLVNDPEEWQRRSDAIYNSARRYEETDITAYWTSLIDSLEKGTLPEATRFDSKTAVLLDEIDDFHDNAVSSLIQQRDQERDNARRLEAERGALETERRSWEVEREALEAERRFWEAELYATRNTVSFRVGRSITWLPRKLRGGIRCYREHGGKYTFYRLLYHLRLAPNNDGSGEI